MKSQGEITTKVDKIANIAKELLLPSIGLKKLKSISSIDDYDVIVKNKTQDKVYLIDSSLLGGSGISASNIANADLTSNASHVWDLDGHSFQAINIGEYFAIGDPEAGGNMQIQPGDNLSFAWINTDDVDLPIFTNQIDIANERSQIGIQYGTNLSAIRVTKDLAQIEVMKGSDITTISINELGVTCNQDITITDTTKGIILKSPNGDLWRVQVDNSGVLSTVAV